MVQSLCKEKNITIAALERTLDFGNGTIKKWGNAAPSADRLAKVADFFGVSVDYLLGRSSSNNNNLYDEDFRKIERARNKMTHKDQEKMLKILKASFEEYFDDDYEEDDLDE